MERFLGRIRQADTARRARRNGTFAEIYEGPAPALKATEHTKRQRAHTHKQNELGHIHERKVHFIQSVSVISCPPGDIIAQSNLSFVSSAEFPEKEQLVREVRQDFISRTGKK